MMKRSVKPPLWAERFLAWYCKPQLLEDLQGDLNEYFHRNLKSRGTRRARLIYILDVLKFLRPYTIRKPKFIDLLIHTIMIHSYIKTSGRSIVRNKLFSAINIVGLAISMSVGLLLIGVLKDIYSYDNFHEHHDRIYRLTSRYEYRGNTNSDFMATTSMRAGNAITEDFTGAEEVAILRRNFGGDVKYEEKTIPVHGLWANESLFKVFTFPLLQGDPETALKMPFSVVLTEESAKKIFGSTEAMGKTIILNNDKEYTVTGIMKDIPRFSHMHFEMLGSLSTRKITEKDNAMELAWDNMWNVWVYLLMPDNADLHAFKENLDRLSEKEDATIKNAHIELALQPLDNIMVGENLGNQIGNTLGRTLILVFSGLAFIVILSACFNYTNLSIARSLRRTREVGIRKVIGALKSHVIGQFVMEAVMISLFALVAALMLFIIIRPHFISMHPDLRELLTLQLSPQLIALFVAFAAFVGMSAGLFPALFFARINAIQVLKSVSNFRGFRRLTLRKVLIVFQYCLSIMLITSTAIIYQQYNYLLSFDLGFNTKNILNIRLQGNSGDQLKNKLMAIPEVKDISESGLIMCVGNYYGTSVVNPNDPLDSITAYYNSVDEKYIPLHELKLMAGRNFLPRTDSATEGEVIVGQRLLKRFNIADQIPSEAIGEVLKVDGKMLTIVGVVQDFQYGKASDMMTREVLLRNSTEEPDYLNVKIQSDDLAGVYAKIRDAWKDIDDVHPFAAGYYDDDIKEAFTGMSASAKLTGYIALLAICIASLGLLGMVVFTTETRMREISIRKVLGASEGKLMYLLGRGFFVLLGISALIALPVTYFFFEQIMFPNIGNHAPIGFVTELTGVVAVMLIALLMIGTQTLKVARSNPAEVLKNE